MNYPQKIADMSEKRTWLHENMFSSGEKLELTRSYFHRTNSTIDMHNHSFYEMNIVTEGCGRHYIENSSCEALPGTVFVIPPGIRHGYWADRTLNIFHLIISYTFIERFSEELSMLPGYQLLFEIEPLLRGEYDRFLFLKLDEKDLKDYLPVFKRLSLLQNSEYKGRDVIKNAIALDLIAEFSQKISSIMHAPVTMQKNPYSIFIVRSMEYIRAHYNDKFSFTKLAEELNMSYSTFLRHFARICGVSPNQYLQRCRIEKSREMLIYTEKSIFDIALECGYYDSSHFIHAFTEECNMSPSAYRIANKYSDNTIETDL